MASLAKSIRSDQDDQDLDLGGYGAVCCLFLPPPPRHGSHVFPHKHLPNGLQHFELLLVLAMSKRCWGVRCMAPREARLSAPSPQYSRKRGWRAARGSSLPRWPFRAAFAARQQRRPSSRPSSPAASVLHNALDMRDRGKLGSAGNPPNPKLSRPKPRATMYGGLD